MSIRVLAGSIVVAVLVLSAASHAEACTPSIGGRVSYDVDLTMAGLVSVCAVTLHAGPSCDPDEVLGTTLISCGHGDRLLLTDEGVFVVLLAPRAARRDWSIVRLFTVGDGARGIDVRLADLPETERLRGSIRVSFAPGGVRFADRRAEVIVPLESLVARLPP